MMCHMSRISVKRSRRSPVLPTGVIVTAPSTFSKFTDVRIQNKFIPFRIRPEGARQSDAEANILSRIKAKVNGYGSLNGDVLGR